jgi:1-acyl-sn-glycerol-3-phosphate acyltransferase
MIPKLLARAALRLGGWRAVGDAPEVDRFVLIAAPHTSNWDFIWTISFASVFEIRITWLGKHTLFRPPFGALFRRLGGIGVMRSERTNLVQQLKDRFDEEPMALLVPAEGTRDYTDSWRSGFYHIAYGADVPVVLGFLDYGTKTGGFGPALRLTGVVQADMDKIRAFYKSVQGKYPANVGRIRLQEEDEPQE